MTRATVLRTAAAAALFVFPAQGLAQAVPKASYVTEGSFQLPGKGQPGAPDRPTAMALGPDGNVHIADDKGLVLVFQPTGVYLRSYGQAQLDKPIAVGVTAEGEAYVLDAGKNQVFVFGPGGQALRTIGSRGNRGGQLQQPLDMALGPSGFVYVLDRGRGGVQIFSRDGLFIRDINIAESVRDPLSMAVGNDGWIYIADERTPTQIYAYPPFPDMPWNTPTPRGIAGRISMRGAQFEEPVATIVSDLGTVVVLDKKVGRLFMRNAATGDIGPNDLLYGGIGTGRGSFREAVDIAFVGFDDILILDSRQRKIERIHLTTEEGLALRPNFDFPIHPTRLDRGLQDPLLNIGYSPEGDPRFAVEVEGRAVHLLGTQAEAHVTVYGDTISIFQPDPTVLGKQYSQGLSAVAAAAVTDSTVLILDSRRNRFAIYSIELGGGPLGTHGDNYQDDRRLRSPQGLAVFPDGRIVIGDTGNNRVKVFSPDLASLVATYPFSKPTGVAIAPGDRIFVWNEDGSQVGEIITEENRFEPVGSGLLPGPVAAIAFDGAGNLFALDRETHRITILASSLDRVLLQLGSEGGLDQPTRIHVDRGGNIYVSDQGSDRTAVFRWDVDVPPLLGFDIDLEEDAAVLRWEAGTTDFIRGYEIQGSNSSSGPYRALVEVLAPPFRVDTAQISDTPPRYVRVVPVFITGVRGTPTQPLPLSYFNASAAYMRGDYNTSLVEASEAVRLIEQGLLDAEDDVKAKIYYYGFASAYQLQDYRNALDWAQKAALIPMPREQVIQFLFRLAEVYMQLGSAPEASTHILNLVGQGPRPEYYMDAAVIEQSFRIYKGVRAAGEWGLALDFIRLYTQSIPSSLPELQNQYRDSVTVFSTRDKLDPGFRAWRNADYGLVVSFFEGLLTEGGLSNEEFVVASQVLAAAYFAFGRRSEAEDTFREIFNVRSNLNVSREIPRLQRLYRLVLYNPETERFFGGLTRS
jgi:tetratricopeptide (TPR) repeat protein/sugar lactone lactonase YvrE